jgi:hypothetical protein
MRSEKMFYLLKLCCLLGAALSLFLALCPLAASTRLLLLYTLALFTAGVAAIQLTAHQK